jgi:hypothetical protein
MQEEQELTSGVSWRVLKHDEGSETSGVIGLVRLLGDLRGNDRQQMITRWKGSSQPQPQIPLAKKEQSM